MRRLDFVLILCVLALAVYGVVIVYSATYGQTKDPLLFLKRQITWVFLGLCVIAGLTFFDYNKLRNYITPIYTTSIIMLLAVRITGTMKLGAQRAVSLGPFTLQPSEFAKLAVIVCLAAFLVQQELREEALPEGKKILQILALLMPIFFFVLIQPDLGTALVLVAVWLGILLASGVSLKHYVAILLVGLILLGLVVNFHLLEDYQMKRLFVFINPELDPKGAGYQLLQSKIAVGSGQLTGKGLFSGTQTNLDFLPESQTDFVFSVLAEELGFFGALLLIALYFVLISRAISIAAASRNVYGALIAIGIATMWMFQVVVNVGMTIGIMPITGIPLPFMSYGGSSMLANMTATGLLLNVYAKRYG